MLADLAASLKAEGRFEEARVAFEKAIELAPEATDYYCGLATVLRELNERSAAATTLEQAIERDPAHSAARQMLAELYLDMGIYTGVIEQARAVLKTSPGNAPALAVLAIACQETGDITAAITSIEQLLRLTPNEANSHYVLGTLYHRRGDIDLALERFERVLELAPHTEVGGLAQGEIQNMDGGQIQQILLLAAENPAFRIELERDPMQAAWDYGFRISDGAIGVLANLDFEQIPERPRHWGPATYH